MTPLYGAAYLVDGCIWERFWKRVDASGDCWLWTGGRQGRGYGSFSACKRVQRQPILAHRIAWEYLVGRIPRHLQIDHRCQTKLCVNPDHMELVTPGTHSKRPSGQAYINRQKASCPYGHPYTIANTYWDKRGYRDCQTCRDRRNHARYH